MPVNSVNANTATPALSGEELKSASREARLVDRKSVV